MAERKVVKKKPEANKKRSASEWFMIVLSVVLAISMVASLFVGLF